MSVLPAAAAEMRKVLMEAKSYTTVEDLVEDALDGSTAAAAIVSFVLALRISRRQQYTLDDLDAAWLQRTNRTWIARFLPRLWATYRALLAAAAPVDSARGVREHQGLGHLSRRARKSLQGTGMVARRSC